MSDSEETQTHKDGTTQKVLEEAIVEMEKSFGTGTKKKSRVVTRGFTLNEIVKESD